MVKRSISIAGCIFSADRSTHYFDPAFPQSTYSLNMLDYYDR